MMLCSSYASAAADDILWFQALPSTLDFKISTIIQSVSGVNVLKSEEFVTKNVFDDKNEANRFKIKKMNTGVDHQLFLMKFTLKRI